MSRLSTFFKDADVEFVYPKTRAVELAKVTKTPVLALQADVPLEVARPEGPTLL